MKYAKKKKFRSFLSNTWTKIGLCLIGIVLAYLLTFLPEEDGVLGDLIKFVQEKLSFSVILGLILTLVISLISDHQKKVEEDEMKTEEDQHKIIHRYQGHLKSKVSENTNIYSAEGTFMELHSLRNQEKLPPMESKDPYSDAWKNENQDHTDFRNGKLLLPTLNLYANKSEKTRLHINDSKELFQLNDFLVGNSLTLLNAHKHSVVNNTPTIRLDDISYPSDNELWIRTRRSNYYQMLVTNRCMDYLLTDSMTLRDVYEYKKTITPLSESVLGNQIGINGLIITEDNYFLLEHRGLKKTTWKDKFAQPISLALKENDLFTSDEEHLLTDSNVEDKIIHVLEKTMQNNYGIVSGRDYDSLDFSKCFLGIARDLLEGGKPNLYFLVKVSYTAKEFAKRLQQYAALGEEKDGLKPLKNEKLKNRYYLVPREDIAFTFDYEITMKKKKAISIKRKFAPRIKGGSTKTNQIHYLKKNLTKECGEALLVSFSYYELLKEGKANERIEEN